MKQTANDQSPGRLLARFHCRSIDMPTGWIGTGFNRWINDETFDNEAIVKDETGSVLLDSTQDKRRKK